MVSINHFIQNRPVHLARRDVYYQAAVKELKRQKLEDEPLSIEAYSKILFLLKVARMHAKFGVRTPGENEDDEKFARFIALLTANAKAVLSMLELRELALQDDSFSFLGTNQATIGLQAEEYQRRAKDIMGSLLSTLELADTTFEQLRANNADVLSDEELSRYRKTYEHVEELMNNDDHRYALAPSLGKLGDI